MTRFFPVAAALACLAAPAYALDLTVEGIEDGKPIGSEFAFCMKDGMGATKNAPNENPAIRWSGAPEGTQSYALIVVDQDVPADFTDANQKGKTIPTGAPRRDFYHWVLVDIPANVQSIARAADSKGHPEGGKPTGKTAYGINGQNDFASFMKGTFGGYDGPCPPFNDERIHRYHFRLYALDTESLGLTGAATGQQAMQAISKHTLAMKEVVGTYSNAQ